MNWVSAFLYADALKSFFLRKEKLEINKKKSFSFSSPSSFSFCCRGGKEKKIALRKIFLLLSKNLKLENFPPHRFFHAMNNVYRELSHPPTTVTWDAPKLFLDSAKKSSMWNNEKHPHKFRNCLMSRRETWCHSSTHLFPLHLATDCTCHMHRSRHLTIKKVFFSSNFPTTSWFRSVEEIRDGFSEWWRKFPSRPAIWSQSFED